jgi:hypothetical protein
MKKTAAQPDKNLTEIAYILDRSGSMQPMQEAAVAAFNDFVKLQKAVPGEARLTLVQFDDRYEVPVSALRMQEVPELTAATYVPRGSTALLDAIGRTIKDLDTRLQKLPVFLQPAKVIVTIFTDGEENASTDYTAKHISDLIALYREQKGWEFLFLAANQDAIASAAALNVSGHHSGNVKYSQTSIRSTGSAMARKVRASRLKASGQMDAQAVEDDAKCMETIVKEEEGKEAKKKSGGSGDVENGNVGVIK